MIEYEELVPGDFPALQKRRTAAEDASLAERKDMETLDFEIMAKARFVFRCVGAFDDFARRCHKSATKFHAK